MSEDLLKPARIEIEGQSGIVLRQLVPDDAAAVFGLIEYDRAHLSQNSDVTARTYPTVESVAANITGGPEDTLQFGVWADGVLVGRRDLEVLGNARAEMKGWIGKEHTGHGYGVQSIEALVSYAFNQAGVNQVVSTVMMTNTANLKTLAKVGFAPNGAPFEYGDVKIQEFVLNNPAILDRLVA